MPSNVQSPDGPQSANEIAAATLASVNTGLKFYGESLDPAMREAVSELVRSGYARASTEGRLGEFPSAAHALSRRIVDGLVADRPHHYLIAPERTVRPITDSASLSLSICDGFPIWPFCA